MLPSRRMCGVYGSYEKEDLFSFLDLLSISYVEIDDSTVIGTDTVDVSQCVSSSSSG